MGLLIDIHCHLDHFQFIGKLTEKIGNAEKAGLKVILTAGINPETNRKALEIASKFPLVKPALGIYPVETLQKDIENGSYPLKPNVFDVDEEIEFIRKSKDRITAIGECGLDYSTQVDKKSQQHVFLKQIELSEKLNKPIIVHSRKAEADSIAILESSRIKKVLLHCFSGRKRLYKKAVDLGYCFSIPTNIVRAENFQILCKEVDLSRLFCETDSPYLSPFKGIPNEPAYIIESYRKIAQIKGMELQEVIKNIYLNYQRLFC